MRSFVRLSLALVTALTFCVSLPPAQQAQTKRGPGKLAPTFAPAAGDSYQVTQTTGTLVPGMTKLTLTTGNTDDGTAAKRLIEQQSDTDSERAHDRHHQNGELYGDPQR